MKTLAIPALAMGLMLLGGCDMQPEAPAQPTTQSRFDKADANRDGVIDQREATSINNQAFGQVDTDDNKVVDFDEFEVALATPAEPRG
jgi:hypothetical protein